MKKFILLPILFFLLSSPALRAQEISLTLDEAIAIGLRDNRTLLLKTEEILKAQAKLAEAQAARLPSVTFTGTASDTMGYYSEDLTQETAQATVKQVLYQGGKVSSKIAANKFSLDAAQAALDRIKAETVLSITKAFYTLSLANQYAALNKAIYENTKEHFTSLQTRYEKGLASKSDLLLLEASLRSVNQAYEASLNQVTSSQAVLNSLLFLDQEVVIIPATALAYDQKTVVYDEAFQTALKNRPELREYEALLKAAQKSVTVAKADGRPTISAAWDYYSRSHIAATTTKGWNDYNVAGLTFSWPIFDGWATKAKVEQAIVDLKTSHLNQEKGIRDLVVDFKDSYLDFINAHSKVESAQAEVNVLADSFAVAESQYKAGLVSSLDFNDVSLGYQVSQFKYQEALYDYTVAKAQLDKAIGEQP